MGDADGEQPDGERYTEPRGAGAGPVLGAGGGEAHQADRRRGARRGAVCSPQRAQLLPGEWRKV